MMDYSLGGPVSLGCYDGPFVNGEPIHKGSCSDGVCGCTACANALAWLPEDERPLLVDEQGEPWPIDWRTHCEWCGKESDLSDMAFHRPSDEPSCMYHICDACLTKSWRRDREAYEEEFGEDYYECEDEGCCKEATHNGGGQTLCGEHAVELVQCGWCSKLHPRWHTVSTNRTATGYGCEDCYDEDMIASATRHG